ncbi:hypothetical protein F2Q70_00034783 [Brassica cretica]|uniref:Uncharacterized protein n=1 Tax=Brassica cretica TaxID=69181 RepID=A0A8S9JZP8_BRACR|nr:hypothetical protein F2Q70_00034783 [Brassica cretica]
MQTNNRRNPRSIRSRQDSEEALTIFFCLGTLPFDISTFVAEPEIDAVGRLFGGDGRDARNREQGMLSTRV